MKTSTFKLILAVAALAAGIGSLAQMAQAPASTPKQSGDADLPAQYRNCSAGYYSGPSLGKTRHLKDDYLWVVTPEFAKAWCMPPEFVDASLKGAEAIAYKPIQAGVTYCGFDGNKEDCRRRIAHSFEIYYKSSLKLPSISQNKYNYRAFYMLSTSKHLLYQHDTQTPAEASAWEAERPGLQSHFPGWGLVGAKGPKPVWSVAAYREIQYIEELLPGLNYLSLEGPMGFSTHPRGEKSDAENFVLLLDKPGETRRDVEMDLHTDYAHVIHLPKLFFSKIRQVDRQSDEASRNPLNQAMPQAFR